jgi:hypothetical protein
VNKEGKNLVQYAEKHGNGYAIRHINSILKKKSEVLFHTTSLQKIGDS